MSPIVSVIVVTSNSAETIPVSLSSLEEALMGLVYEVIVVDNASVDKTVEVAKKFLRPDDRLIVNHKNLGFSRANNQAFKIAKGDYIWFLNPDCRPFANSGSTLLNFLEARPRAVLAGGCLVSADGLSDPRTYPRPKPGLAYFLGEITKLNKFFSRFNSRFSYANFNPAHTQKVFSLRGSFLMAKRLFLEQLGHAFDPRYFIWFEDVDLCAEANQKGMECWYVPESRGVDFFGQSFKKKSIFWRYFHFVSSSIRFVLKWYGVFFGVLFLILAAPFLLASLLFLLFKR